MPISRAALAHKTVKPVHPPRDEMLHNHAEAALIRDSPEGKLIGSQWRDGFPEAVVKILPPVDARQARFLRHGLSFGTVNNP